MRRFFFLLLFSNLAYGAWAALVRPPPTVPVNQAFARLAPLKLVDELPPSERPDPAARKTADTPGQCLSVGPFGDVDNSAKAAALLHSLARNHALVDGNKRLALAALIAFYGVNGRRLTLTNDAAYELVMKVAVGQLDSVHDIAAILSNATESRA